MGELHYAWYTHTHELTVVGRASQRLPGTAAPHSQGQGPQRRTSQRKYTCTQRHKAKLWWQSFRWAEGTQVPNALLLWMFWKQVRPSCRRRGHGSDSTAAGLQLEAACVTLAAILLCTPAGETSAWRNPRKIVLIEGEGQGSLISKASQIIFLYSASI